MTDKICVAIASHISTLRRIDYLIECLDSLAKQTTAITIYLSISFENDELYENFVSKVSGIQFQTKPVIKVLNQKTAQMRHYSLLQEDIQSGGHEWILFCDDDDTYQPTRVEMFLRTIELAQIECSALSDKKLAGIYESTFGKMHQEHRHEYWCYCISAEIYYRFFNKIDAHPEIIDNKCCDIVFAEYFRRMGDPYVFGRITDPLYNYRVENNGDSITGVIQYRQKTEVRRANPPPYMAGEEPCDNPALQTYVEELNKYVNENMSVYLHDTYLRSVVGVDFDLILQKEFTLDYPLLAYVDYKYIQTLKEYWEYLRTRCNEIYDIKF